MSKICVCSEEQVSPPMLLPLGSGGDEEVVTCCMKFCDIYLLRLTPKSNISHFMAQGTDHCSLLCRGVKVPSLEFG